MGQRFTITKRGIPVAMIVPLQEGPRMTPEEAVAAIREIRSRVTLGDDLRVKDLIEEGRR